MDALLVVGGLNLLAWGPARLARPLTGFPLAALYGVGVLAAGWVPDDDTTLLDGLRDVARLAVCVDAAHYVAHRAAHVAWRRSHALHHAHARPTPSVAFDTGVVDAVGQLLVPLSACVALLRPGRTALVLFGALYSVWLQWIHSSGSSEEREEGWLVTPAFHRAHHRDGARNLGHVLTLWDHLGGTTAPVEPRRDRPPPFHRHPVVKRALQPTNHHVPWDCVAVHGNLYAVADVARVHPGGTAWIAVVAGTDATRLFETMHLDTDASTRLLRTLRPVGACAQAHAEADSAALRRAQRLVLHGAFPTRASRRETPRNRSEFRALVATTACLHLLLLAATPATARWAALLGASAVANTVLGGYGHDYLHALDARSLALDWNGLSSFEWLLEHVVSHHPAPNTERDHDAISMRPVVHWNAPSGTRWSMVALYAVFAVGELVVAAHGNVGHRCRWKAVDYRDALPAWLVCAPWLFVLRAWTCVAAHGLPWGAATLGVPCVFASFYFSFLAHLNHAPTCAPTADLLDAQLQHTRDLRAGPCALGLDRQTLHHLFPSVAHCRLDGEVRDLVKRHFGAERFAPHSVRHLHSLLWRRIVGREREAVS